MFEQLEIVACTPKLRIQARTNKSELALVKSTQLLDQAEAIGDFKLVVAELEGVDPVSLQTAAERLLQKLGEGAVVLGSSPEAQKVSLVVAFSPSVIEKGLQAGKFIGAIAKICGGGGGGRPNLAQAGGRDPSKLPEALAQARQQLKESFDSMDRSIAVYDVAAEPASVKAKTTL